MILFELLTDSHNVQSFRSGAAYLDHYLRSEAIPEQARDLARTFVALDTEGPPAEVIGYFTLKLTPQYVPQVQGEWLAVGEIACLARDASWRGRGLGSSLLLEALRLFFEVSQRVGCPGVFLYASQEGVNLYEAYGFQQIMEDRRAYFLSSSELKAIVEGI